MSNMPVDRQEFLRECDAAFRDGRALGYARGYAAGLEQAAKVCDARVPDNDERWGGSAAQVEAADCAAAIRALAAPTIKWAAPRSAQETG